MASGYEVRRGTASFGPYTTVQLKEMAAAGRLQRDDLVRKVGTEIWNPARLYAGLFPGLTPTPAKLLTTPDLPPVPTASAPEGPAGPAPDVAGAAGVDSSSMLNLRTDEGSATAAGRSITSSAPRAASEVSVAR